MADRSPLFLLLIFWTLSTGVFGVEDIDVFSRSGETVHLPCNNTVQHCRPSETTWTYSSYRQTTADELICFGRKKAKPEKHERLILGSDCSLIISRVTTEDAGLYTCQQWSGNQKQGNDSVVFLHVVAVSVSSSSSDIGPGLSLTLSCQLYSDSGFSCDDLFSSEGLHLSWVNEAGVDLNTDSRYQISSTGCIISLSTTLISEDEDKQWRCGVYQRNQLKTSDTFTVHYSAPDPKAEPKPQTETPAETTKAEDKTTTTATTITTTTTPTTAAAATTTTPTTTTPTTTSTTTAAAAAAAAVTPEHNKHSETKNPRAASPAGAKTAALTPTNTTIQPAGASITTVLSVLLSAAALAVFIAAVLCLIQRRRRAAAHQRASGESAVKDENQVHYQTIHMSINPAARAHEQTEDSVTYSEVTCAGKKPEKSASDDDGNDSVTYAAVSRRA